MVFDASQDLRVLVLTPPEPDVTLIRTALSEAHLPAQFCADIMALCHEMEAGAGAALLTEESLQPPALRLLIERLGQQPPWSDFPLLVFFNGGGESIHTALRMLDLLEPLGNVTIMERPVRLMTLVSAVRAALHARARQYQVRRLLSELEEAVRRRDSFLVQLAHELRTPLGTIRNATHILERVGAQKTDICAHQRTVIGRQTSHLARLIDDLLDASRVTSGKIHLQRQAVDLRQIVERALSELETAAEAQRLRVSFAAASEPILVEGDARRLEQVAANLVQNAVNYTPAEGDIRVSLKCEGDDAVLRVADSGVGISPEKLSHVFDLFPIQEAPNRPSGGLGIGLPLVRALVEMQGGKVEAHSGGSGRGSEFVVRLPLMSRAGGPASLGEADRVRPQHGRRVLIVEDNPDGRESLRLMLSLWGHQVEVAGDGQQGVAQALALRPEVALVDIGLPLLDGYEVGRRVRAALGRDIFLIALTGYGQPHDYQRAFEAGFDAHLVKPAEPEELRDLLARLGSTS